VLGLFIAIAAISGCRSGAEVVEKTMPAEVLQREFKQHFFNGQKDRLSGNMESAIKSFNKCIELIPGESAPYYEIARLYERQNRLEAAIGMMEKAIAIESDNIWYNGFYAQLNARAGRMTEAVDTYRKIIEQHPTEYDYHFELAGAFIMMGQYDKAIGVFDELEQRLGTSEEVSMQKQMLYMEMEKPEEAINEVKKLVAINPDEMRYWGILAELYAEIGERDKALETYEKLLEMDENNGVLRLSMAEFYREAGDHERSFEELKLAFKSADLEMDAKINVLLGYYRDTEHNHESLPKAYELCEILVKEHPDAAQAHSIYGDFLYRDNRLREARDQFGKAAALDKNRFIIWNQILILDSQLEDYEAMVKTSAEAMELFPTMPSFYLFHGVGLIQQEKYEEAIEALLAGVDLVVDNFGQLAQFYASLGDAYHQIGEHEKSDEAYDSSLSVDEDNAFVLNNYSYYLSLRNKELEKALKMSKKANELQPDQASFQDTHAWVLYRLERYEEAREWLEKALNNGGITQGTILEHYGDVLY
jgi:tetratricopeptide (TPR) repeat protein